MMRPKSKAAGFTMIELIIVIAILVTLSGVLMPFVFRSKEEAQAAAVLNILDSLRRSTARYYLNTGQIPREHSDSSNPNDHNLYLQPATLTDREWKGPYLQEPFRPRMAGVGTTWQLGPLSAVDKPNGFSLDPSDTGMGVFLSIQPVTPSLASYLDEIIDGRPQLANWKTEGKVMWGTFDNTPKKFSGGSMTSGGTLAVGGGSGESTPSYLGGSSSGSGEGGDTSGGGSADDGHSGSIESSPQSGSISAFTPEVKPNILVIKVTSIQ